jgi:hypothetical protein
LLGLPPVLVAASSRALSYLLDCRPISRALLSAGLAVLVVIATGAPQGSDTDSGWQFKALQQHFQGSSPTFNTLVSPDPQNLSANVTQWISWWAPGSGLLLWPLLRLHLTLGLAIRIVAISSFLAGSLGWSLWVTSFQIPKWVKTLLSVFIPWSYYAHHNTLFFYGAEALLFAAVPWTLLLAVRLSSRPASGRLQNLLAVVTGASLGLLYVLKYSGLLVSIGAMTYILLQAIRSPWRGGSLFCPRRLHLAGLCALACVLPIIALNLLNLGYAQHMNLVSASRSLNPRWPTLLFGLANPVLAAASADAPLRYLLSHPTAGLSPAVSEMWLGLVGLPGAAMLWFLLSRRPPHHAHARMACCLLAASVVGAMVIWTISDRVTYESRHIAGASIAALPYVLEAGWTLRPSSRILRMSLAVCSVAYIALPLLYGVGAVIGKTARQMRQHPGPSRIYNPLLARHDVAYARSLLVEGFDPTSDLWYVTHPVPALDLPGRTLIRRPDSIPIEELRQETFHTMRPLRVRLVLPASLEADGRAEVIRQSFPRAVEWIPCPTDGATRCWTSWIRTSAEPIPVRDASSTLLDSSQRSRALP